MRKERKRGTAGRLVPPAPNLASSGGRLAAWAEYDATPASIPNRAPAAGRDRGPIRVLSGPVTQDPGPDGWTQFHPLQAVEAGQLGPGICTCWFGEDDAAGLSNLAGR